jgi:hypothetical protein
MRPVGAGVHGSSAAGPATRVANDGNAYTYDEFASHYTTNANSMWMAAGSAEKPASAYFDPPWTFDDILQQTPKGGTRIGRNETHAALVTLFKAYFPTAGNTHPGALDITDMQAFPWNRWLVNVLMNREVVKGGIVKVFAVRDAPDAKPMLAFCHPDDTYTTITTSKHPQIESQSPWRAAPMFTHAVVAQRSWMEARTRGFG